MELPDPVASIAAISAVPAILNVACEMTGMGFAAVARVTEDKWIACSVLDHIRFGLKPGEELEIETTICNEIRDGREAVVIDHVAQHPVFRAHHTPALYGFQSYISVPIILPDGHMFGTLCAIDPKPRAINNAKTRQLFALFAELIAFHLQADARVAAAELELQAATETSELREQFIAVLGHDLRNPLAAIGAGVQLLARETLSERGKTVIIGTENAAKRMAGLIDNIMDFARGRLGGGIALTREPADLTKVLTEVIRELRSAHPRRPIEAHLHLPKTIDCDPQRIAQLLSNLLGNALTHGDEREAIQVEASTPGSKFMLSVSNHGKSIPAAAMERLFQPFFRGAVRRSQQGLGLGLHIASTIAQAHGGRIDVRSDENETCFTFSMPLAITATAKTEMALPAG